MGCHALICPGGAEISKTPFLYPLAARFEDFEPLDTRVQYFWEALNNFTNGE